MRYFLDTEYNGWGGALISLALVPEQGDQEYYLCLPLPERVEPWVERHVLPYLDKVPHPSDAHHDRAEGSDLLGRFLAYDSEIEVVADWPEDIAHFCNLLTTGGGRMISVGALRFTLASLPGFSTARNSAVPHNALHDARALRDFVLELESLVG